jgi:hypothetical protein
MGKMPTHIRSFIQDIKPLYYVAKILGIAPFTLKVNAATNGEIIDIKFNSNICGFAASAVIFILLLIGFVFATFLPQFSLRKDPLEVLTYAVSVPLNFIGSLVLVIMNSTVNRYKLEKLVKKLTSIDKSLTVLRSGYCYQRERRNVQVVIPVLVLAVIFLSSEVFLVYNTLNPVFCVTERSCQVITLVALLQHCKMALMIRSRLCVMYEILSCTFSMKLSHTNCDKFGSNTLNVTSNVCSHTSKTLHTPRLVLLNDLEAFNGTRTNLKTAGFIEVSVLLKLRRIYHHLYDCSKIINFMYGLPILIYIFRAATGLIALLYELGVSFDEHREIYFIVSLIIWTSVLLGPIISLTIICDMDVSKTKDIGHKLQALLLKDTVSSDVVDQLKLFCQQISNDRIVFTAAGLFDVNLSFLCTFLTTFTSYIIVMIQLKLH